MSHQGVLTAQFRERAKKWRTYLPFPLELESCACPICSSREGSTLMRFDQFGFPIGTVECQGCGFIYTNPRPTEKWMNAFYERYFWFFFQGRCKIGERFFRRQHTKEWAALRFGRCAPYLSQAKSILEIGSGSGLFLDQVRRNFPTIRTSGIEPDCKMVKYSREVLGLDVHQGFFQSYKSDSRFDVITLFHVIEHLFDLAGLFEFVRGHLAPGGLLIMEAPNVDGKWKTIYMIQLSHLHIFSPRTIKNLFAKTGFEVIRIADLENQLDESNLFVAGRIAAEPSERPFLRDPQESTRILTKFQKVPKNRSVRVLRAWVRLAYFAVRR